MLAIVVVNQSITGRPPLQDKLSTRSDHFRSTLRQSLIDLSIEAIDRFPRPVLWDGPVPAQGRPDPCENRAMLTPRRYRTILLFGMPGSGKGTQGAVLGQLPGLIHISCGDVFRKIPKHGELGREVMKHASAGLLVPDDLTVRLWERHIQILEMQELLLPDLHTLILDGLPRNYAQAARLDEVLDVVQIFHLKIDDLEKATDRLKSRALRENRLDDTNEEVIRRRLQIYYDETYQTLSFYDPGLIFDVDAAQSPIDVLRTIIDRMSVLEHEEIDATALNAKPELIRGLPPSTAGTHRDG